MPADDEGRGASALSQLRAATMDICNVIPLTAEGDFQITNTTMMTGNALLVDSRGTALEYDRTPAHIARGGLDHYHVTLCLEGEMGTTLADGRVLPLRAGMSYQVADNAEAHRSATKTGAKLFIVD